MIFLTTTFPSIRQEMMILQTTTDSDSVKDIDTKAAEIDFLPPLSFVILNDFSLSF